MADFIFITIFILEIIFFGISILCLLDMRILAKNGADFDGKEDMINSFKIFFYLGIGLGTCTIFCIISDIEDLAIISSVVVLILFVCSSVSYARFEKKQHKADVEYKTKKEQSYKYALDYFRQVNQIDTNFYICKGRKANSKENFEMFLGTSETQQKLFVYSYVENKIDYDCIKYENISKCELIMDGAVIMEGGVDRAIIGGILAGGVGAIVGAQTRSSKDMINELYIRIMINDISNPICNLFFINSPTEKSYSKDKIRNAEVVYGAINAIINTRK